MICCNKEMTFKKVEKLKYFKCEICGKFVDARGTPSKTASLNLQKSLKPLVSILNKDNKYENR